jgi:hypothetical protein
VNKKLPPFYLKKKSMTEASCLFFIKIIYIWNVYTYIHNVYYIYGGVYSNILWGVLHFSKKNKWFYNVKIHIRYKLIII